MLDELCGLVETALLAGDASQPSARVREVPDRRTIRWYTTIGLLDRPAELRGRTALYQRRHLLQLVAIKRLQARGVPLAEVQVRLAGATDGMLAGLAGIDPGWPAVTPAAASRGTGVLGSGPAMAGARAPAAVSARSAATGAGPGTAGGAPPGGSETRLGGGIGPGSGGGIGVGGGTAARPGTPRPRFWSAAAISALGGEPVTFPGSATLSGTAAGPLARKASGEPPEAARPGTAEPAEAAGSPTAEATPAASAEAARPGTAEATPAASGGGPRARPEPPQPPAEPVPAILLGSGITLTLGAATRPLDHDDLSALSQAAEPLLELLRQRGLDAPNPEGGRPWRQP